MKIKFLIHIVLCLFVLSACSDKNSFSLEGNVSGTTSSSVYVLTNTNGNNGLNVDTVYAEGGKFKYTSSCDSVKPIILYFEEGSIWVTVWAQNGQVIKISGDINYPELIEIKENEINNKLTSFRQGNKDLIKEKAELIEKMKKNNLDAKSTLDEDYSRKLNLEQALRQKAELFVKENPTSIASLVLIQDYILESNDPGLLGKCLSIIEAPAREDRLYSRLDKAYQHMLNTSVGSIAPDFSIEDTQDSIRSLSSFQGKYLILSFKNSKCESCKEDYAVLKQIYKDCKREDVEIFTIAFDEQKQDWETTAKENDVNWLQAVDTYGLASPILAYYNVNALPDYFLMDREGKIIGAHISVNHVWDLLKEELY